MERLYTTDEWEGIKANHAPIQLIKEKAVIYKTVEIAEMDLNNQILKVREAMAKNMAVSLPYHDVFIAIEPCCVYCSCKTVTTDWGMCKDLDKSVNMLKTPIEALKKATMGVLKELAWSALYRAYCVNKNIIASLCWLTNEVKKIKEEGGKYDYD